MMNEPKIIKMHMYRVLFLLLSFSCTIYAQEHNRVPDSSPGKSKKVFATNKDTTYQVASSTNRDSTQANTQQAASKRPQQLIFIDPKKVPAKDHDNAERKK